mmetsp:Transcript_102579/g.289809  ORF Transcript_102579/g.289809 Transcript_102579/m.289809 type:complete len:201 (-) Transcript_102579:123-725(-)
MTLLTLASVGAADVPATGAWAVETAAGSATIGCPFGESGCTAMRWLVWPQSAPAYTRPSGSQLLAAQYFPLSTRQKALPPLSARGTVAYPPPRVAPCAPPAGAELRAPKAGGCRLGLSGCTAKRWLVWPQPAPVYTRPSGSQPLASQYLPLSARPRRPKALPLLSARPTGEARLLAEAGDPGAAATASLDACQYASLSRR